MGFRLAPLEALRPFEKNLKKKHVLYLQRTQLFTGRAVGERPTASQANLLNDVRVMNSKGEHLGEQTVTLCRAHCDRGLFLKTQLKVGIRSESFMVNLSI